MYNKDQWISSFEDCIVKLRPHTSSRMLVTAGIMAWTKYGSRGVAPETAANEWSMAMDRGG